MPADHLDRKRRAEDDARSLGIDPDVVLGRRRDIALAAWRAAHDDAAADLAYDPWVLLQRQRDVGERTQRYQREARLGVGQAADRLDRVPVFRRSLGSGVAAIAEPIASMEPVRVLQRPDQRSAGADEHGNV